MAVCVKPATTVMLMSEAISLNVGESVESSVRAHVTMSPPAAYKSNGLIEIMRGARLSMYSSGNSALLNRRRVPKDDSSGE